MSGLQRARFLVPPGPLGVPMASSDATALRLFKAGPFGADLIRFPAGGSVPDHTHPGSHMLFVLSGSGWVDYEGVPHRLAEGDCYYVPGSTRHGIRAEAELTLLSVADDHRDAGSPERLHVLADGS